MSDDANSDLLVSGALLAGAGVMGFFGARWLLGPRTRATPTAPPPPPPSWAPPAAAPSSAAPIVQVAPSTTTRPPTPTTAAPPRLSTPSASPGPVTSPDQVAADTAPTSATAAPSSAPPRTFDRIFNRYRGDLPIELLRALAVRESGMDPREHSGPGWGLFQITEPVRADFNRAHGTAYTRAQLLDPDVNVRIATWLLRFIVDSYAKNHPGVANLRPDWRNPRFAELVVFGWNAGPSEAGGVGRVVGHLEKRGAREIDLALVHEHARDAGASKHLSNPAKVRWSRSVVALYQREHALTAGPTTAPVA